MAQETTKVSADPSVEGSHPLPNSKGSKPGDKATLETPEAKADGSTSGKGGRKHSSRSKRRSNLVRFTPMVRFDSQKHVLVFTRKGSVDGVAVQTDPVSLDLSGLDESTRQAVIAGVKFCMNFSNGAALEDTSIRPMEKTPKVVKEVSGDHGKAVTEKSQDPEPSDDLWEARYQVSS